MREVETFREHDTKLSLWLNDPNDARLPALRQALVSHLRRRSFRVRLDARIKRDYPILRHDHHEGHKGDLRFKLERHGRHLSIEFYQELATENRSGGQYDFHKRQKMPYLIGLQYEVEKRHIAGLMAARGFVIERDVRLTGMAFIKNQRAELSAFQGKDFYARPPERYNSLMGDGELARDGTEVWFAAWPTHRWHRGVAFHHINNMWWVLLPCGTVRNVASFKLYRRESIGDPRGRYVADNIAKQRLQALLTVAINAQHYERAAVLRDILRARFPLKAAA